MVLWRSEAGRSTATQGRPGIGTFLFALGRRDTAIFLWLLFGLVNQFVLVLIMAAIIAPLVVRRQRGPARSFAPRRGTWRQP